MLFPIIPETSIKALKIFNLGEKDIIFSSVEKHEFLKIGSKINKIEILFKKIEKIND
jgi:methionyl-tRNA synthetase